MEILERALAYERRGERVIHLEVGEPDLPTPEPICDAARSALRQGKTGYTHSLGLMELREAIAENYGRDCGVEVSPDQIVVTSGTSPGMLLAFSALLEPGDEVVLGTPHYACYPNFIEYAGGVPVYVELAAEEGYELQPEGVREAMTPRTKAILINSPANPTGAVLSGETIGEIVDAAGGAYVVSDEIYHGLVYEGEAHSVLEYTERAFVLNGFSKLYAMTGWRLGYLIAPQEFVPCIQSMQQNFFISANAFVQWAGVTALRDPECTEQVKRMVKTYDERRKYIVPRLREIGFRVDYMPRGAYYVLANARSFSEDSLALAKEILNRTYVAVTPGIDFGDAAEGFLRFSYANSLENIEEGLNRIEKYLIDLTA
ncbi:MAG: pyridoxal phosphate-dependent aminotransferase [bacterium]